MEDAKTLVRKLLEKPYRDLLLQDMKRTMDTRRNRKQLEEIEKELAWFNGKKNNYRVEDRQGFLKHFQENYRKDNPLAIGTYRSVCDYPSGKEPKILYFMFLYVKRRDEMQAFQVEHPLSELRNSLSLNLSYKKLLNEFRLLDALLNRVSPAVAAVEKTIDETFRTDFLEGAEELSLPELQSRFLRAVRLADPSAAAKLVDLMDKAGAKDTTYPRAMVALREHNYEKAAELAKSVPAESPVYLPAQNIALECAANLGDIDGFVTAFEAIKDTKPDSMHFIYLLQNLVCNASYSELDTDEFEQKIQGLLKNEFNQNANPLFTGLVSRKFVNIMLEGLPLCEELVEIKKESGEDALPQDKLDALYRLQMALQLYPVEEVGNLIDMDYMAENGADVCRRKLGRQAIAMLLEKNPDKSFENVHLAFEALEKVGMMDAFAGNIETNIGPMLQYAKSGQKRALALIEKAAKYREEQGQPSEILADALNKLNGGSAEPEEAKQDAAPEMAEQTTVPESEEVAEAAVSEPEEN